jgi:glycosyltransferase involved in cell wall biosynthesis
MPFSPTVILSIANIRHYYYTALALHKEGYLKRFICSVGLTNNSYTKYLPNAWGKRLNRRNYDEIEPSIIKTIPWTELIPRGLNQSKIISSEQTNWLFCKAYDWVMKGSIGTCDYFHFVVPAGINSARKAKNQGSIVIADVRTANTDYQINLIKQENDLWGFKIKSNDLLHNMSKIEYEIADYIIVPSKFAKNTFLNAGFDENKIFCIPYGVDQTKFSQFQAPTDRFRNNIFRILYVGHISPLKGIHYLIQAFGELNLPDAELLLIGHIEDSLREQIEKAVNMNKNIRAIGSVPQGELQQYYSSASVFVLPSLTDSFGMVTLEAMACGIPVIVSENTGSGDAVCEGVNGFVIPIRNAQRLAEKLAWIYDHPDERRIMGVSARERALEYTWEHYENQVIRFYNELYSHQV